MLIAGTTVAPIQKVLLSVHTFVVTANGLRGSDTPMYLDRTNPRSAPARNDMPLRASEFCFKVQEGPR
jgi:hypothetical protein